MKKSKTAAEDKKAVKKLNKCKKIRKDTTSCFKGWDKALDKANTINDCKKIDKKYSEKIDKLEKKDDKAYADYFIYLVGNYDKKSIHKAVHNTKNFTSMKCLREIKK